MRITLVRDWHTLQSCQAEWNALVEQAQTNAIFQTFEWHDSWIRAFGSRCELFVLLAQDDANRLVGIAPLVRVERWFWGHTRRVLELIGTNTSGYCDLIVKPSDTETRGLIFRWLIEHRLLWDALDWVDVPETSATMREAQAFFRERGYKTHARVLNPVLVRPLENPAADRAVTNTRSLRWHRNRLQRQGELEFRHLSDFDEMTPYLILLFEMHVRRRQVTAMPSFFRDDAYRVFYTTIARTLAAQGRAFFCVELLSHTPIALGILVEHGRRVNVYQFTFDLDYARFSPGTLLVMDMLGYALQRGATEFDLGPGDQPYKYRIANLTRANMAFRVCQFSTDYYLMRLIVGVKTFVGRSPRALALARRLTEMLKISERVSLLN
jgi:CelD/BcsL family acetyltransferase involved in cellulose biosynthesis